MRETMKKILVVISIVLFSIAILVLGYFSLFVNSVKISGTTQSIGRNVEVASVWQEIKLAEPLNFNKRVQYLRVSIQDSHTMVTAGNTQITLGDGSVVNPEIELINSAGETYRLENSGSVNDDPKFSFANNVKPDDKVIKLVRIKSNANFVAKELVWVNMNLK